MANISASLALAWAFACAELLLLARVSTVAKLSIASATSTNRTITEIVAINAKAGF